MANSQAQYLKETTKGSLGCQLDNSDISLLGEEMEVMQESLVPSAYESLKHRLC